ncbi:hypothetical protein [Asticcacaulis tiandongensis]|uniref:hypothetical protein n=1 Tax=Asticcacaulis tiandongensis TaxID=2565365 RepID=UPI00112D4CE7|nr:hypothetical protein [Asticcacaulis tiandongensis]
MTKDRAAKLAKSVFACLVGAIIATAFLFLYDLVTNYVRQPSLQIYRSTWGMTFWWGIFAGIGFFLALCLIGLPIQWQMQKRSITALVWHSLPAFVMGGFLSWLSWGDIVLVAICGLIAGTVAWLVRRPDRMPPEICLPPSCFAGGWRFAKKQSDGRVSYLKHKEEYPSGP